MGDPNSWEMERQMKFTHGFLAAFGGTLLLASAAQAQADPPAGNPDGVEPAATAPEPAAPAPEPAAPAPEPTPTPPNPSIPAASAQPATTPQPATSPRPMMAQPAITSQPMMAQPAITSQPMMAQPAINARPMMAQPGYGTQGMPMTTGGPMPTYTTPGPAGAPVVYGQRAPVNSVAGPTTTRTTVYPATAPVQVYSATTYPANAIYGTTYVRGYGAAPRTVVRRGPFRWFMRRGY